MADIHAPGLLLCFNPATLDCGDQHLASQKAIRQVG